ncbi:MAG TPA: bifunctional D-glycero-beta-D-manno-heptose-7-phosphate kinase/D-glycero-beta-D-manno-heptose 1-phosphate adenylyltransferase HldE [Gammaproteobacteria bacterium]|nr:bifunctional D-glycero-beta-D-manno-heptose-7-phosphate kinase/D-glycero-beta-D-manno-heptose 1-phosphate adenylyltransferase HldE [Gammaproteobacteria bacterium]
MTLQLPKYEKAHVLVVGDTMLDKYWYGATSRISPEAPVPVVHVKSMHELPGGAANVALNIRALGTNVNLLSMSGDDDLADSLESQLKHKKISVSFQRVKEIPTISKIRILSLHQQLIRLDFEEGFLGVSPVILLKNYEKALKKSSVVVLSDYGKGVLAEAPKFIALANKAKIPVFVDPKGSDYSIYKNATLLTPNRKEFEAVVGKCKSEKEIVDKALKLIRELNLKALLVTRGEEGMSLIQPNKSPLHLSAKKQEVYDVTGAGDTVIGVLAASVASGASLEESMMLSNIAAGIVVTKLGAATVSPHELRRALQDEHNRRRGIMTEDEVLQAIRDAHAHGEKVVMTNGCFDLLHLGHVQYLEEAKKLGDHLIVAVNDDNSVKKLKGPKRPLNALQSRMGVLLGLASVDWVVPFSEETPERLINKLLPDILVKGADYKVTEIAGHKAVLKNGGEVRLISLVPGHSTTKTIEKMGKGE